MHIPDEIIRSFLDETLLDGDWLKTAGFQVQMDDNSVTAFRDDLLLEGCRGHVGYYVEYFGHHVRVARTRGEVRLICWTFEKVWFADLISVSDSEQT